MGIDRFAKVQPQDRQDGPSRREFVELGNRLEALATQIKAVLDDLERPLSFDVTRVASQSIINNQTTTVEWDSDTRGMQGGGLVNLATGIFTATRPGLWLFTACIELENIADQVEIRAAIGCVIAGVATRDRTTDTVSSAGTPDMRTPPPARLALMQKGDTAFVDAFHSSAAPANLLAADSFFRGVEIGRFR